MNTPLPWKVWENEQRPFDLGIKDAQDADVIFERRHSYSSSQKTLEQCKAGTHMGKWQEQAVESNRLQLEKLDLIVRAVNNHQKLVTRLRAAEVIMRKENYVEQADAARALLAELEKK